MDIDFFCITAQHIQYVTGYVELLYPAAISTMTSVFM